MLLLPSLCPHRQGCGATGAVGAQPCGEAQRQGAARFWLQVRPRGSAGWESSLRQKPPVRLIFQAGQARHEMKIKEMNSVETLRDLPTPLRVRVCLGLGLPRGFPGPWRPAFCCAVAKRLQACCSLSVPQFPL